MNVTLHKKIERQRDEIMRLTVTLEAIDAGGALQKLNPRAVEKMRADLKSLTKSLAQCVSAALDESK